jgi:O-acetylserine/cysteine efflux transporter
MPWSHLLLALAVVAIWGTNFVVIKLGLAELPPFLFVALRFFCSALPMLVLARPQAAWGPLIGYGLLIGVGQFGLLFYAMHADITPGLASLVVQMQVFFTIGLSALLHRERLRPVQGLALALAVGGMGVIAWHVGGAPGGGVITPTGVLLVLGAALCWALGNLVVKRVGRVDMLAFMAWSSLWPALGLSVISLGLEGPDRILHALAGASAGAWGAVAWQAVGNTLFGYAVWSWLLTRHPAATVTPMALLVPVFGMGASALVLGEALPAWKLVAAGLVMLGLALNVWVGRRAHRPGTGADPTV